MLDLLRPHVFSMRLRIPMTKSTIADAKSLLSPELGHDL
uniref:Uncharacterized protein n=1 Tax=Arundo donax TaxID=35708 RepID=A0A0A8Z6J0_ARUDO